MYFAVLLLQYVCCTDWVVDMTTLALVDIQAMLWWTSLAAYRSQLTCVRSVRHPEICLMSCTPWCRNAPCWRVIFRWYTIAIHHGSSSSSLAYGSIM